MEGKSVKLERVDSWNIDRLLPPLPRIPIKSGPSKQEINTKPPRKYHLAQVQVKMSAQGLLANQILLLVYYKLDMIRAFF